MIGFTTTLLRDFFTFSDDRLGMFSRTAHKSFLLYHDTLVRRVYRAGSAGMISFDFVKHLQLIKQFLY